MAKKLFLTLIAFLLAVCLLAPLGSGHTVRAQEEVPIPVLDASELEIVDAVQGPSNDEFNSLGYIDPVFDKELLLHKNAKPQGMQTLASSYSLVDAGYVTPVKDQNPYGTCWTFAAMGSAESGLKKKTGTTYDLAELQLAWYNFNSYQKADPMGLITNDGNQTSNVSKTLDMGGNQFYATFSLASGIGLSNESAYPYPNYSGYSGTTAACYNTTYRLRSALWLNMSEKDVIKQALLDHGALATSYYHDNDYLNSSTKAYYQNATDGTNHAITLVGWNDNYSKTNFKTQPSSNGAWLIKNSWGTGWGNSGYFWISYEDKSIKNNTAVFYEVETDSKYNSSSSHTYQNDGSSYPGYLTAVDTTQYEENIYTSTGNQLLTDVGFVCETAGTNYTIIVYKNSTNNPMSGSQATSQSGTITDGGYHLIKLNNPVTLSQGEKFGVLIQFTNSAGMHLWIDKSASIKHDENLYNNTYNDTTNDISYYYDGSNWYNMHGGGYTCRIKAVTRDLYTIKFVNYDNTVLQSSQYAYGETPSYTGSTPTRASDAQYTYTFTGWSPSISAVTGDKTYTAQYSKTTRQYTVKFVNYDDSVLQSSQVAYGQMPSYNGQTPTKPATAQYTYTFNGWSPSIAAVTGNAIYKAQYTQTTRQYTIKFVNYDGTVLQSSQVAYGQTPAYTGATPTKPASAQYTYTFSGWSPSITAVNGDKTYTAQFSQTVNKYTVEFVNVDGEMLQSSKWEYGATPVYSGPTPVHPYNGDPQFYEFIMWEPNIVAVTGDATYTARYRAILEPAALITSLENEGTDGGIKVTYLASPGAEKFEIQVSEDGGETWLTLTDSVVGDNYSDISAVVMGKAYTYRMRPYSNDHWSSYWSPEETLVRNPFIDVEEGTASFTHVAWAYNNGIVNGISTPDKNLFGPDNACTRAQFCIMLYKMNGLPAVTLPSKLPFSDISSQTSNTKKAIVWCAEQGIVEGKNGKFNPKGNITRAQLAIMLYKMAGKPAVDISDLHFTDIGSQTSNTKKAIVWCWQNHLIDSLDSELFEPTVNGSRALLTEMMYGYDQIYHIVAQ